MATDRPTGGGHDSDGQDLVGIPELPERDGRLWLKLRRIGLWHSVQPAGPSNK